MDPLLENYSGKVSHTDSCQWGIDAAKEMKISMPVISASLDVRYRSWENLPLDQKPYRL